MLKSLFSAFLMYSRIPVPQVEWKEENRRYALCFFPLVGIFIGGFFMLWQYICGYLNIGLFLRGAVALLIPTAVTGGIHLDGFCDVSDAVTSYGDHRKRLEIMKDPHVGAFAVLYLSVCLIMTAAIYSEISDIRTAAVVSLGFVLSRSLSGLAAVSFKSAKSDGTLQSFVKPSHRNVTVVSLSAAALLVSSAMICVSGFSGVSAVVSSLLMLLYYRISSVKRFGGITGDTAGWFLVLCEIFIGASAVISEKIMEAAGI